LTKSKVLVFAAHPDDEVLGCGGTMAKISTKGGSVRSIVFSDGVSSRKNNKKKDLKKILDRKNSCILAAKILGSKKPIFGTFPDNELDTIPLLQLVKFVEKYINKYKPNLIFTHFNNDLNIDHQLVSRAVVTACRPQKKNTVKNILFFEIPSSTEWKIETDSKKGIFNPNWFEEISKTLSKKIKAIKIYKEEIRKWPHPRSTKGIKVLAEWRGATAGYEAAEAFVLGRKL